MTPARVDIRPASMPVYEYRCERCGDFEEMQRITDPPLSRCPTCRRKVRRLISSTSFQLKGSGWYVTDYARTGSGGAPKKDAEKSTSDNKAEAKAESAGDSKAADKATGKAETKPASSTAST